MNDLDRHLFHDFKIKQLQQRRKCEDSNLSFTPGYYLIFVEYEKLRTGVQLHKSSVVRGFSYKRALFIGVGFHGGRFVRRFS